MAVTQARLSAYRAQVGSYADAAGTFVREYVSALTAQGLSVADVRDEAIEAVRDALNAFGDQAASLALDLLEGLAASYGVGVTTSIVDAIDGSMVDGGVRYAARKLAAGDAAGFTESVSSLTRYYVSRSAFENMAANCERNDLRYARVPSGLETCSFCFMLSSRGFVYHTAQTAGEGHPYHENCDCVIVPGFEGLDWDSQVEGYSPTEMRERWRSCADTVGVDPDTRDESKLRIVRSEVATRDFRWLNTGAVPAYKVLDGARPNSDELATAERLSSNGFSLEFRATRDTEMLKTSDLYFVRADGSGNEIRTEWEVKNPRGSGKQTIYHQFEEAAGQAHVVVIDLAHTGSGRYDDINEAVKLTSKFIKYHYTVKGGANDGSEWLFDEALLIAKDGSIRRIKRGN